MSWEAYQTYEDDSIVEWIGEPDAEEPAAVTEVVEGEAVSQHGGEQAATSETTEDGENNDNSSTSGNWLPISLAIAAILIGLISLFRKRS